MAVILRAAATITGATIPSTGFTSTWWSPATAGGSTADATDILARFRLFWVALAGVMDDALTIDFDPICIAVEATTGVLTGAFAGTDPTSVVGTAAGDPLPMQTQGLVRLQTSTVIAGRRVRGRLFVPGPPEAENTSAGVPSGSYTTALANAGAALLAAGSTASAAVIWHRPTAGAGGASPVITGVSGSPTWSVLKSRRS